MKARCVAKTLKAGKATADKTCGLVFPTAGCKPKLDFLKAVREHAKLDEDNFWLYMFRATRHSVCLSRRRSAQGAAMASALRYGIDDAMFEALTQSAARDKVTIFSLRWNPRLSLPLALVLAPLVHRRLIHRL
jgi:hypothetical protein